MSDVTACIHEAAHALTAHAFGIPIVRVFIDAGGGGATLMGRSLAEPLAAPAADGFPVGVVRAGLADLCVTLAGPAGESLLAGRAAIGWERLGCDVDCAERAALRVAEACGVPASALGWRAQVMEPTRAFLLHEWHALERVAVALARARELSGARVAVLAGRLDPPDLRAALAYAHHLWRRHGARRARERITA